MVDISCPECKKIDPSKAIDRVEKVSAVVVGGTPAGRSLSLSLPIPPEEKAVSLPPEPTSPSPISQGQEGRRMLGCGFLIVAALLDGVIVSILGLGFNSAAFYILLFVLLVVVGLGYWYFFERREHLTYQQEVQQHKRRRDAIIAEAANEHARAMEEYDRKFRQYQQARRIWDQLYYCSRHDLVFLPGGSSKPRARWEELLR